MHMILYALALLLFATPAWANTCPNDYRLREIDAAITMAPHSVKTDLVRDLRGCLEWHQQALASKNAVIEALKGSLETALSVIEDPVVLVESIPRLPNETLYNTCENMWEIAFTLKSAIRDVFLAGEVRGLFKNADFVFDALTRRYVKPDTLKAFYYDNKPAIVRAVETRSTRQFGTLCLNRVKVLFDKPFVPLIAAQATEWYLDHGCHVEVEKVEEGAEKPVCTTKAFADAFQKHYGVPATPATAYFLGIMNRRYLSTSAATIAAGQEVALDLLRELSSPSVAAAKVPAKKDRK